MLLTLELDGQVQGIAPPKILQGLLVLVITLMLSAYSSNVRAQAGQDEWQLLKEEHGVQVFYQVSVCDTQKMLHFKIKNDAMQKSIFWTANVRNGELVSAGLPSMAPRALAADEELSSDCANISAELSLSVEEDFTIEKLVFNLFNI